MPKHVSIVLDGTKMNLLGACQKKNLNYNSVRSRIKRGWSILEALDLIRRKPQVGWVKGRKRNEQNKSRLKEVWRERKAKRQLERQQQEARKLELTRRDVEALRNITDMSPTDFIMDATFDKFLRQIPVSTPPETLTGLFTATKDTETV